TAHVGERYDLDHVPIDVPLDLAEIEDVVQRVVERPEVRIHLRLEVARKEAEPLSRLDGRPREDDLPDEAAPELVEPHRDRQVRLPGPRGPDAEDDVARAHRLGVPLLARGPRPDRTDDRRAVRGGRLFPTPRSRAVLQPVEDLLLGERS